MDDFSRGIFMLGKRMLAELRALGTILLGVQNQIGSIRDQQEAANRQQQEEGKRPQVLKAELQIPEAVQDERRTSDKDHLRVQRVIAIATTLAFMAAAYYACINSKMLDQMKIATDKAGISADAAKRAADTATRQLELSERPWVFADIAPVMPLTFDNTGMNLTLQFVVKNAGHSPAFVWKDEEVFAEPSGKEPIAERERFCREVQMAEIKNPKFSDTVFPGIVTPQNVSLGVSWENIRQAENWIPEHYPGAAIPAEISFTLIVCIAYRPTFANAHYKTAYILTVGRSSPVNPLIYLGIPIKDKVVPLERIRLILKSFGGIYAD